jgi:hypothetical protein
MCFNDTDGHKYYLCEYPNDSPCENDASIKKDGTSNHRNAYFKYNGDTYSHLYSYLSNYFQTNPNTSVAIFHTSQGMPSVSWAFGVAPVIVICPTDGQLKCTLSMEAPFKNLQLGDCPLPIDASTSGKPCYKQEYRMLSWPGIQRSSVNIFKYQNTPQNVFVKYYQPISTHLTLNQNLLQSLNFSQCYNFNNSSQQISGSGSYYCQYSGSLASGLKDSNSAKTLTIGNHNPPAKLTDVKARICYPPFIVGNSPPGVADSFGHCS